MYVYTYIYVYIYVCVCIYVNIYVYICIDIYIAYLNSSSRLALLHIHVGRYRLVASNNCLQHAATHCSTLQLTTVHYITMNHNPHKWLNPWSRPTLLRIHLRRARILVSINCQVFFSKEPCKEQIRTILPYKYSWCGDVSMK